MRKPNTKYCYCLHHYKLCQIYGMYEMYECMSWHMYIESADICICCVQHSPGGNKIRFYINNFYFLFSH